jgi:hypothetical protein
MKTLLIAGGLFYASRVDSIKTKIIIKFNKNFLDLKRCQHGKKKISKL